MSSPNHDPAGLVPTEGVDEGSAAETVEGPSTGSAGDVVGEPPHGAPVDDEQAAAPVDMESAEARDARDRLSPGQQLQEGEG